MNPLRVKRDKTSRIGLLRVVLLACLGLAFGEGLLRISNVPDRFAGGSQETDVTVELDEELGWKRRPGSYLLGADP